MKIKFKNIRNRVSLREQTGLAVYHQKFGGEASLELLSLLSKINNRRIEGDSK